MVSEVPALLIFFEFRTETRVSGYLRPRYVEKSGKRKCCSQSIHTMLAVQFHGIPSSWNWHLEPLLSVFVVLSHKSNHATRLKEPLPQNSRRV